MKIVVSKIFRRPLPVAACFFVVAVIAAIFASVAPEPPPAPTVFSEGDIAPRDLIAQKEIAIIDPAETEVLREKELSRVPATFRFQSDSSAQAVSKLSTEFVFAREKFWDSLEQNFKARMLNSTQLESQKFRKFVAAFRAKNPLFPFDFEQAKRWAQGDAELELQYELETKLRAATSRMIREDALPKIAQSFQVRLMSGSGDVTTVPLDLLKPQTVRRTNLVSLARAKTDLLNSFPRETRPLGKALTNFIEVNCFFDAAATQEAREEKAKTVWAVVPYEAGQVIVRRGEVIDSKIKAALDELKIVPAQSDPPMNWTKILLWIAATLCAVFASAILWIDFLSRPRMQLVRARNVVPLPRAQPDVVEAKIMPHLARGLMNRFVRALISQRSNLMKSQAAGTDQLNQLEERLEQINTRLQARQLAYEKRIAELERELAAAEEENRELIREKIREARENLERTRKQAGAR